MSEFQKIIDAVSSAYRIVPEDYPVVAKLSEDEKLNFSLSHTVKHLQKSLGKIANQLEEGDHGNPIDRTIVRTSTFNLLISAFKLCDEQGITGDELVEELPKRL